MSLTSKYLNEEILIIITISLKKVFKYWKTYLKYKYWKTSLNIQNTIESKYYIEVDRQIRNAVLIIEIRMVVLWKKYLVNFDRGCFVKVL